MNKTRWLALGAVALSLCALLLLSCGQKPQVFTVLHFNDFHGQVEPVADKDGGQSGGLARLAGLVDSVRADNERKGIPTLLLCAGDVFTGTAFSTLFQGGPEFKALGLMKTSAMTTGNHEWDFGPGVLSERARGCGFPLVVANVAPQVPGRLPLVPFTTLTAGRLRVGIIGVTTADTPQTTAPGNTEGFTFSDPVEAVGKILTEKDGEWDFVVVLSHCGFEVDKVIASKYPAIGLIVGGHDHKVLERPWIEKGVPIVQAGDRGRFLGEVTVSLAKGRPAEVTGRLLPVTDKIPESAEIAGVLAPYLAKEESALGAVIGRLPSALEGDRNILRTREAAIGDLLADAMRNASGADLAFVNSGAIRAGLPAGEVTGRDLYACLPFFDSLSTVRLTGAQIQALLDRCASMPITDPPGGFLQVSNISVVYRNGNAEKAKIGGAPIDPTREYVVACSHFLLSGGDGLKEFTEGKDTRDWGVSLQELMRRELVKPGIKIPSVGSRLKRADLPALSKAA
jgi:5'-nucleotidase/UDP-sugar diphosphatase